jgi:hypothetical protein
VPLKSDLYVQQTGFRFQMPLGKYQNNHEQVR